MADRGRAARRRTSRGVVGDERRGDPQRGHPSLARILEPVRRPLTLVEELRGAPARGAARESRNGNAVIDGRRRSSHVRVEMRIAQVSPLFERVLHEPMAARACGVVSHGGAGRTRHAGDSVRSADSKTRARLVPGVPRSLRNGAEEPSRRVPSRRMPSRCTWAAARGNAREREFDVIHYHTTI